MVRRFYSSAVIAGAVCLAGHAANAQQDLEDIVGTIARTVIQQQQAQSEQSLWNGVVANGSAAAYRQYLDAYPEGPNAREARRALDRLQGNATPAPTNSAAQAEAGLGLTRANRVAIQQRLADLGFYRSGIDGAFGAGTRRAIASWQASRDFSGNGYLNAEQMRVLLNQGGGATPAPTPGTQVTTSAEAELSLGLSRSQRVQIQRDLTVLGYDTNGADGLFGTGTRDALRSWQRSTGERVTGYVTAAQIRALRTDAGARTPAAAPTSGRPEAVQEELLGLTRSERVGIQQRLIALGYLSGRADGAFGSATRTAIGRWQSDNGMSQSGYMTAEQVRTLQTQQRI